jgi:cytochrome c biogenesis protein CcdA/thiol-disulfide isomerase/thioredoxin
MAVLLVFAFVSGVITILSPCILPVLPIVLAGGSSGGKARPFGVISGFVASFSFFTLALAAIVQALGIDPDAMRYVAIALIVLFGLVMIIPKLSGLFEMAMSRVASKGAGARAPKAGFWGGIPVGLSLGLVWTPCVGPIMASVISLALTKKVDGGSIAVTVAYSIGTALPMLGIMIGGRALLAKVPALTRHAPAIQRGFGVVMLMMGLVLAFQWDRQIQTAILTAFPSYGSGLTAIENLAPVQSALKARSGAAGSAMTGPTAGAASASGAAGKVFAGAGDASQTSSELGDYGAAPEFVGGGPWLGTGAAGQSAPQASSPLSLKDLRGKVVLVDFWTYSCVNCVRTLPYLKAWYAAYKDSGFTIVGVHSPEFAFERSTANVARAMRDLGVAWPVVQDNDYAEWNAYGNKYWPAHYLIDAKGRVRQWHFGEGSYAETEAFIRTLLAEAGSSVKSAAAAPPDASLADETPETYLGFERGSFLASAVPPVPNAPLDYKPARVPGEGEWNLDGKWTISGQFVRPESEGSLALGFNAKDVYLVAEPEGAGGSIAVLVDGVPAAATEDTRSGLLKPDASRLYHIVALKGGGRHLLKLEVKGRLRLYSFTFG